MTADAKFVHAADLHLDSPMRGLERYEGAPVGPMRAATRKALEGLVDLCIQEEAKLLLLAGDLYDGDWRDYATGLFFASQMSRLRHEGVDVVWVRGNHDAASQISKHLRLPDNVRELSTRSPETVVFEELGVAVHGQSFSKRVVTRDLAAGYPDALADLLNVGVLHTCATGREGHEPYAPCTLETLRSKGYGYWALGHVHQREVLSEDPWIVFPGNLQGRHARELGPKGATLVSVHNGRVVEVEERYVDAARWSRCEVDASEETSPFDVVDRVREALEQEVALADGRPLAVRLIVVGRSEAHDALMQDTVRWESSMRAAANDVGDMWLEKIRLRTQAVHDLDALAQRDDAIGQVARSLRGLPHDDARLGELVDALSGVHKKLPKELRSGPQGDFRLDDVRTIRSLLPEVEQMLLARLLASRSGPSRGGTGA